MATAAHNDYLSFDEFLKYWADERPDGIALEDGDRKTTYGEAEVMTRKLIAAMQARGVANPRVRNACRRHDFSHAGSGRQDRRPPR